MSIRKRYSTMVNPKTIESLCRLFEDGNFKEMETSIDFIVEKIRKINQSRNIDYFPKTSIKRFFIEYIVFVIHIAYDYGVDVEKVMDYEDPYSTIFEMQETPIIKKWVIENCKKMYVACKQRLENDSNIIINQVDNFINNNYSNSNLRVTDIANNLGISFSYLSSIYSENKGITIIKQINTIRLEKVRNYLLNSNISIQEISEKCGYSTVNRLYYCFKKKYGVTPLEYRKNKQ